MGYFLAAGALAALATVAVRALAQRWGIVDRPDGLRKRHLKPVPLWGGVAVYLAFWVVVWFGLGQGAAPGLYLLKGKLVAAFIAGSLLLAIGLVDEARPYSARWRLLWSSLAIALGVGLGLYPERLTNPAGGWFALPPLWGGLISFIWLLGITYTAKILDGLDGLTVGTVAIGALMIFFLTISARWFQPNVAWVAKILVGASLGFLVFNFYPARIFLGEGGGLWLGFSLGVLAIIGGGKLATAMLVMAVPILDLARVIYRRWRRGQSIFEGDREHVYFQLLDRGWTQRQVVAALYLVAAGFGALTLVLQSYQKLLALLLLGLGMVAVGVWLRRSAPAARPS